MNKNLRLYAVLGVATALGFASCKDKDKVETPVTSEQELITTLKVHLVNVNDVGDTRDFKYYVSNGFNGGGNPTVNIDTIRLRPNCTYSAALTVLDESKNPVVNVTDEIKDESINHLFTFQASPLGNVPGAMAISNLDKDVNGNPLGLNSTWATYAADTTSGKITITLKHKPLNKNATTPDAAGGETDLQATFPTIIKL